MFITDLEAVNGVLRELGEQPLDSLGTDYPTEDLAKVNLVTARRELLTHGWWFNTVIKFTIKADANGRLKVPDNTLEFIPDNPTLIWSGAYLMSNTGETALGGSHPTVQGKLKFDLEFNALPYTVQQAVVLAAAASVYASDFGPDQKYQEIRLRLQACLTLIANQHLRSVKPSIKSTPSMQRYYRSLSF